MLISIQPSVYLDDLDPESGDAMDAILSNAVGMMGKHCGSNGSVIVVVVVATGTVSERRESSTIIFTYTCLYLPVHALTLTLLSATDDTTTADHQGSPIEEDDQEEDDDDSDVESHREGGSQVLTDTCTV